MQSSIKMLLLSLTGQCNLACKYCYASGYETGLMTEETALRAIDMAAEAGGPFLLQFSGGEPLLNFPVMEAAIRYVGERRIPAIMQVQTNGTLVTGRIAEVLKNGRVGVGISLDGRGSDHDGQRCYADGRGTMPEILAGAAALKRHGVEIGLTCVVTERNVKRLTGVVELAYYLGNVRRIGFDLLRGQGRGASVGPAAERDIREGLWQAFALAENLGALSGQKLVFSQLERVEKLLCGRLPGFGHCHAMNGDAVYVDAKGDLYACASLMGKRRFYIGSVDRGIDKARQSEIVDFMQKSLSFCPKCADFSRCGGCCFARWYGAEQNGPHLGECALKRTAAAYASRRRESEESIAF